VEVAALADDDGRLRLAPRERSRPTKPKAGSLRRGANISVAVALAVIFGVLAVRQWKKWRAAAGDEDETHGQGPLPYINYAPVRKQDRDKSGTTINIPGSAERGYALYIPKPEATALLIDMRGKVVHKWSNSVGQPSFFDHLPTPYQGWQLARLTPKGELLTNVNRKLLVKLDWDSKIIWQTPVAVHHEISIADDGDIYTITEEPRLVEMSGHKRLISDHGVTILSPEGSIRRRISFYDVFQKNPTLMQRLEDVANRRFEKLERYGLDTLVAHRLKKHGKTLADVGNHDSEPPNLTLAKPKWRARLKKLMEDGQSADDAYDCILLMRAMPGEPGDVFHANTVTRLKAHPKGLWKDGDLLVSLRTLDLVFVFDPADDQLRWSFGPGELLGQHQPSPLPNGNILVFDNGVSGMGSPRRPYSRIVEIDPTTNTVVWEYEAKRKHDFYSPAEGSCQLLPGGNMLVAEAEAGRAFQITRDKKMVWEYFNPKFSANGKRRSAFYRIEWLPPSMVEPLLRK
jgi:hypothetical protein